MTITGRTSTARAGLLTAFAAFSTYFCMHGFRKPFTAATFDGEFVFGMPFKECLILAQLCGYMAAKVVGVKFISEMPPVRRGAMILLMIGVAELSLLGFAVLPRPLGVLMLFVNGFPLGMIFGLVLSYLEGRRHTEALAAGLCASFIMASGVVKSIGRSLVVDYGVSEFAMPAATGILFLPLMFFFVWLLQKTPPPTEEDLRLRSARTVMSGQQRWNFLKHYAPGLSLLLAVYVVLTAARTMRDDFAVEIWQGLGVDRRPEVFAQSETIVAVIATALNALAICFVRNLTALIATATLMSFGFAVAALAAVGQSAGQVSAFVFMVACGIGLYLPYVAFHTTVFERLIAASRRPGNLAFLMYLADSLGYLGYAAVMGWKMADPPSDGVLPLFRWTLIITGGFCITALVAAMVWFRANLQRPTTTDEEVAAPRPS